MGGKWHTISGLGFSSSPARRLRITAAGPRASDIVARESPSVRRVCRIRARHRLVADTGLWPCQAALGRLVSVSCQA
jgi:hypothetical protein